MRKADTANKAFKMGTQKCAGGYGSKWNIYKGGPNLNDTIKYYRLKISIRSDWEIVKLDIMGKALLMKFTQNKDLKDLLLGTDDRHIIEHTTKDTTWGDGGDGGTGEKGMNLLGKSLMELRQLLRFDEFSHDH